MDKKSHSLTPRLMAAAGFVRHGATIADVGTDHAYLPIYLVSKGIAKAAVASDINEGPYLRALTNIRANSLENKISAVHCAGLCGIDAYSPTDIIICGMGGELIASIIDEAKWTKNTSIRLVLQPMTHSEILRDYLLKNGFAIIDERLAKEEKIYEIICAEYLGTDMPKIYSEEELLLGRHNIKAGGQAFCELVSRHISTLKKISLAKSAANADHQKEDNLINKLQELIS